MITIHHLGVSQSDRIVWLMEELELPYELKWYDRGEDMLAPAAYRALHPLGTAPVIHDGDRVLAESTAIVEYVSHVHAGGRLSVTPDQPNYADYLYWLHFNNNAQSAFFVRKALETAGASADSPFAVTAQRRETALYRHMEARLSEVEYLAGPAFTCADIMAMFNLTALPQFGGRDIDDLPHVQAYVARVSARPAYRKAMAIAGPQAKRPAAD